MAWINPLSCRKIRSKLCLNSLRNGVSYFWTCGFNLPQHSWYEGKAAFPSKAITSTTKNTTRLGPLLTSNSQSVSHTNTHLACLALIYQRGARTRRRQSCSCSQPIATPKHGIDGERTRSPETTISLSIFDSHISAKLLKDLGFALLQDE